METNKLKAFEICKIIETCGENSVSEISFHGITIKFQARGKELADTLGPASDPLDTPIAVSAISEEATKQAEDFDRAQLLDSEEALLLIDDPVGFEKTQIDQDIERNRGLTQ